MNQPLLFETEHPTGPAQSAGVESGATFSPCRKFRYKLWRQWNVTDTPRFVTFIGVNPSVANETDNDRTITRCINFAKSWGYDGLKMLNAFAWIQTSLTDDLTVHHIGDSNNLTILDSLDGGDRIIAAWGTLCPMWRERQLVGLLGAALECLDFTKDRRPKHPLYVRGDVTPKRFVIAETTARSRRTDPSTSKEAARKHDDSGKTASDSARITAYVHIHRDGVTAAEVADGLEWINGSKVDNVRVSRRIADLIAIGEVKYRLESSDPDVYDSRTCRIKGRAMLTIWPAY